MADLAANFRSDFMSSDSRLFRTFGRLTTNPGRVAREFIDGKRRSYYRPIAYFVFAAAIYLGFRNLLGFDPIANQAAALGQAPPPVDVENFQLRTSRFMARHINTFAIGWTLIFAFFSYLFYKRSGLYYAEHLTFSLYTVGQFLYFSTIFIAAAVWIAPQFFYLTYIFQLIYLPFALVSFHSGNRWWLTLKGLLVTILSYLIYVVITFVLIRIGLHVYDFLIAN